MTKRAKSRRPSNSSISSSKSNGSRKRQKSQNHSKKPKSAKSRRKKGGRIVIQAANGKTYIVEAVTCLRGCLYIRLSDPDGTGYAPYDQFVVSGGEAVQTLRQQGLIIIGNRLWPEIRDAVGEFRKKDFKQFPLVDRPGWTSGHFALASGDVFSPLGGKEAQTLFSPNPELCRKAGELSEWKSGVAKLLVGQHLAAFVLMTAFAAPLLRLTTRVGNFSFEITGSAGKGKSTLQQILASAAGYPFADGTGHYGMSLNATVNGLEIEMLKYADMVMPLEEATLFVASGSSGARGSEWLSLVFRSSDGTTKSRGNGANASKQDVVRFIQVLSGNEPVRRVLGRGRGKVNAAALDRLITLPINDDREHGTFDFLPVEFSSAGALAETLKATITQNHGVAIHHFLRKLVNGRATDEAKLKRRIQRGLAKFREEVGVDGSDGSAARLADAFGLVYVAGLLAKRYGVLPNDFRCLAAAKYCYRLHLTSARIVPPFRDRLIELAKRADVVNLDEAGMSKMSKAKLARVPAFLRTNRSHEVELLLTKAALRRALPDWAEIKRESDTLDRLVHDRGRLKVKRQVRRNRKFDWVYCFRFPCADD